MYFLYHRLDPIANPRMVRGEITPSRLLMLKEMVVASKARKG
jgi:hypothetical protein